MPTCTGHLQCVLALEHIGAMGLAKLGGGVWASRVGHVAGAAPADCCMRLSLARCAQQCSALRKAATVRARCSPCVHAAKVAQAVLIMQRSTHTTVGRLVQLHRERQDTACGCVGPRRPGVWHAAPHISGLFSSGHELLLASCRLLARLHGTPHTRVLCACMGAAAPAACAAPSRALRPSPNHNHACRC